MANIKKTAFTLGVASMTFMPMKSLAQNQENLIKEFKKQQQVELREFKFVRRRTKMCCWKNWHSLPRMRVLRMDWAERLFVKLVKLRGV